MVSEDLKYTKTHEWVRLEGDTVTVGITDFAFEQLGDIVFIELPSVGDKVARDNAFGVIESVKAAVDLNSPVSGQVVEVNEALADQLDTIAEDPYGASWMIKVKASDLKELDNLMTAAEYKSFVQSEQAKH